jgi:type II secretory pathway component GspD/PulD (secretin)
MRVLLTLTVVLVWLATSVVAQENAETPPLAIEKVTNKTLEPTQERTDLTPAQLRDLAATLKINEALNKTATLDVVEMPLYDVVRKISREHGIPIILDPEGLETSNVTADQLVTIKLVDISLRNALRTVLKPLHLSFTVRNEVLTITALDCPDGLATVRTFPLGRLTERMDDPSELISTLEMIWPDDADRIGEAKVCQPRARILANHLVVRGSPRHLDLAEQLIDGLMAERPEPEVKATLTLPPGIKSQVLPLPSREPSFRRPKPTTDPSQPPPRPRPPQVQDPEAAALR